MIATAAQSPRWGVEWYDARRRPRLRMPLLDANGDVWTGSEEAARIRVSVLCANMELKGRKHTVYQARPLSRMKYALALLKRRREA